MRMPRQGVITQRARSLGQNHGESDEGERLPKLRHLIPNEKSKETATGGGEESANGTLLGIVTQCRQLGSEIERCTENWKREQPHSHVSVFRRFEMQVDHDAAIDSERAEQRVLHLHVRRFECTSKSCNGEHHGRESERGPIVSKKSPRSGCGRERTEIGMNGKQRTIG